MKKQKWAIILACLAVMLALALALTFVFAPRQAGPPVSAENAAQFRTLLNDLVSACADPDGESGARIEADLAAIGAVNGRDGELARAIAEHWQKSFLDADNPLCLYQGGRDAPELAGSGIPDSRTHAFVVLGYELMDGQMQSELVGRCEAAAAAARSYPSAILVCSGGATGPNNPEGHTEAGLMKQYLTEQCGIDAGRIFIDERAMTTQENAVNTFEILKEQGVRTMTIVTSSYHQRWGESVYHTLAELCRREGYPVEMVGSYSYETEPTVEAFRQSAQIAAMQMAGILQLPGGRGGMRPPRS